MATAAETTDMLVSGTAQLTMYIWRGYCDNSNNNYNNNTDDDGKDTGALQLLREFIGHCHGLTELPHQYLLYAVCLMQRYKRHVLNQCAASGTVFTAAHGSECRVFIACYMAADKMLDDRCFSNRVWADITGLPLRELNIMELELFASLHYSWHLSARQLLASVRAITRWAVGEAGWPAGVMRDTFGTALSTFVCTERYVRELPPRRSTICATKKARSAPPPPVLSVTRRQRSSTTTASFRPPTSRRSDTAVPTMVQRSSVYQCVGGDDTVLSNVSCAETLVATASDKCVAQQQQQPDSSVRNTTPRRVHAWSERFSSKEVAGNQCQTDLDESRNTLGSNRAVCPDDDVGARSADGVKAPKERQRRPSVAIARIQSLYRSIYRAATANT